jgi:hypothetical protein
MKTSKLITPLISRKQTSMDLTLNFESTFFSISDTGYFYCRLWYFVFPDDARNKSLISRLKSSQITTFSKNCGSSN